MYFYRQAILFSVALSVALGYPNCARNNDRNPHGEFYEHPWQPYEFTKYPACEAVHANPRGKYSADLAPCTFHFHVAEEDQSTLSQFELSTACSEDNLVYPKGQKSELVLKDYVKKWPDDCVKDFPRCYSVPRDEPIYLEFVCSKGWVFPEGTTHVSVDCREDWNFKNTTYHSTYHSNQNGYSENYTNIREDPVFLFAREIRWIVFIVLGVALSFCIVYSCVAYGYVFKPYLERGKEHEV